MQILKAILFLAVILLITFLAVRTKSRSTFVRFILGTLCFIAFFIAYYFIVFLIAAIPLYFIAEGSVGGTDNGSWTYALIAGMALSPILASVTTFMIMKRK